MPEIDSPHLFYLGRGHDLASGKTADEPLLYKSSNLTTHAVCVGMTGSGKTGLCLSLLEEAALDGVPVIAIDPKGDLGNLLLAFPESRPEDYRPWIDEAAAQRKGQTPEAAAAEAAVLWRDGLAKWGQDAARVKRYADSVERRVYTPGASHGLPMTVLRSFDAPPKEVRDDDDSFRQRVSSAVSGLLGLLGIDADPVRSREHILLSTVLTHAWEAGKDVGVADLIKQIKAPPFTEVGVLPLDEFFPEKQRSKLAMDLNNLLASPSFAGWVQGQALSVPELLYGPATAEHPAGKPRLAVVSIAHLDDAQRMFFVTILLSEVLAWMRTQSGTSGLRAILYMDEVFGYFPPTANPPSKQPMLTLLKQARAFGLGVVLATQNPVDLDYKGLSNCGTWFLGRLQTERDKMRVMEGLEGASAQAGSTFDKQQMERNLAGLGNRVFLMNNVHEDAPRVFQTRWAMSYLCGPLSRGQIQKLMDPLRPAEEPAPATSRDEPQKEPGDKSRAQSEPAEEASVRPPSAVPAREATALAKKLAEAREALAKRRSELVGGLVALPFSLVGVLFRVAQLGMAAASKRPTQRKTSSAWAATERAGDSAGKVAGSWSAWREAHAAMRDAAQQAGDPGAPTRTPIAPLGAWLVLGFYTLVAIALLALVVWFGQQLVGALLPATPTAARGSR
ncbi:MAG: ATP-binding protein [Lacipirellulaceae bacterium]